MPANVILATLEDDGRVARGLITAQTLRRFYRNNDLVESLGDRHHAVIVGEPGVGKTCILRALRARLPESGFRLTYFHNATLGRRDSYRQLCLALGLPVKATVAGVFCTLNNHVNELARDRVHPVFFLDEAQLMRDEVLQHLHILSNYSWDQKPLLSIVLVGLPDLWRRLSLGIHRSLWSRIHCRVALEHASAEDTVKYISYRLERTACLRRAGRKKVKRVDIELLQDLCSTDDSPTSTCARSR